jgi:predicted ATPase
VDDLFPSRDVTRWQDRPIQLQTISLEITGPDGPFLYELVIEHRMQWREQKVKRERLLHAGQPLFEFEDGLAQLYKKNGAKGPQITFDWMQSGLASLLARPDNERITWFKDHVAKFIISSPQPPAMGAVSAREERSLAPDMANFASWYRYLSQEHQEHVFDLTKALREIIPAFRAFALPEAGEEHRVLHALFHAPGSGERDQSVAIRFDELSDGQRLLIALYAVLHGASGLGYSLFLDEPDNYLALPEIQPWLTALNDAVDDGAFPQVLLISHHPELIDYLGVSDGCWLERADQGPVRVKRLPGPEDSPLRLSEIIARGWVE